MSLFRKKPSAPPALSPIDIHNHILPGVDDGFRDASASLEAIRRLSTLGVSEIVFTPHLNPDIYASEDESSLRAVYDSFSATVPPEWGVKTSLAAEYMIVRGFEDRADDPSLLLYGDGKSILIEMSYYFRSPNLEKTVFNLVMSGKKPILAHPERYLYMCDSLRDFDRLAECGCRFQMNCLSLSGIYGKGSLRILSYLKKRGLYSFMATDLHSLDQLDAILRIRRGSL